MKTNPFPRMHVSYYVKDINATVKFYNTFFDQEPEKVKPAYAKYILEEPSLIISFIENPEHVKANFGHLGFEVESKEEMQKRLEAARKHGIVAKEEMGVDCCYAVQDKFWVSDPDGVKWEVYFFHADSVFEDPTLTTEAVSACCEPGSGCC